MRPPDLPGGNIEDRQQIVVGSHRFNEAAGFTRRKPRRAIGVIRMTLSASMRPPDLPGGNMVTDAMAAYGLRVASMRPPDLPGGNPPHWLGYTDLLRLQ